MELKYERSEIDESLIEECNKLSEETGRIHFIFDTSSKLNIEMISSQNTKMNCRDAFIDIVLETEEPPYYIGDIEELNISQSRYTYYDTETKEIGRYPRYNVIVDFLKILGFKDSISNFGIEYEQVFNLEYDGIRISTRVKPNMFIEISTISEEGELLKNSFFFQKDKILQFLHSCKITPTILRDIKINYIIN